MSVLIKGMKMPEDCFRCPMHHLYFPPKPFASDEVYMTAVPVCMAIDGGKQITDGDGKREEFCPIKEEEE